MEEELCEASVNHLIPLSRPLGIPADKFYTTVIANMLKKMVCKSWRLISPPTIIALLTPPPPPHFFF